MKLEISRYPNFMCFTGNLLQEALIYYFYIIEIENRWQKFITIL